MPNPEIRFLDKNGSDYGDWSITQLSNVIIEKSDKNKNLEYLDVWSVNNKLGFIKQKEQFENRVVASDDVSNYKIVYPNMYAYNPSRINVGSIARSKTEKIGIVSPMYIAFTLSKKINFIFFDNYIKTFQFKNNIKSSTMGSVRDSLSFKSLQLFNFAFPCLEEQERIAEFFTSLDNNIEGEAAKLKAIKGYKKSMLQKMFSESGNPEVRFTKDDGSDYGDWVDMCLGEHLTYMRGGLISKSDLSSKGEYCILYGELYTKYKETINEVYSKTLKEMNAYKSKKYDLIIPTSGETAEDIALATSCVLLDDIILGGDLMILRPNKNKINGVFLAYYLRALYKVISPFAQGVSVVHLYWNALSNLKIYLPQIEEQERIAEFFSSLDRQIDLHSKKLDNLKKYKKSMLQKMFV